MRQLVVDDQLILSAPPVDLDPAVARALKVIQERFAEELDATTLAREAGVSRSVLRDRFVEALGDPPMRYCARWRMHTAAKMLREGGLSTANVGYAVGFSSEAAFNRAFKREFGQPPATWKRVADEQSRSGALRTSRRALPPQEVRFCTARDGTRLAWSAVGNGPPLIKTANWLNHIEFDWQSPLWRHWLSELTNGRTLIRYDERGNGLSDWDSPDLSFEAFVDDLESVVEASGVDQFDLLGISQGAAVAIAYSLRHPERVRRLIIYGGYARGWAKRLKGADLQRREALVTLTETGWGADNPAYRQLFTSLYVPDATTEQMEWFNDLQRISTSPPNAVRLQRVLSEIDVSDMLPKVKVPTMVAHARDDQVVPFSQGEELAATIPGAVFVALEGRNHILLETEPAWRMFTKALERFVDLPRSSVPAQARNGDAQRDTRPNQLFVSGTPTGVHWVTKHIGDFLELNPDLSVQLDPNPRMVSFESDGFDCAIRCGRVPPRELEVEELFKVEFTPMCSPQFLARYPVKTPADLLGVPRITPSDPWWHDCWRSFGIEATPETGRGVEMGAQMLDSLAAQGGQGVALLTPLFWRDEIAAGKLVQPLPHIVDGKGTYWLVYPRERANWSKVRRFSRWLHGLCGGAAAVRASA